MKKTVILAALLGAALIGGLTGALTGCARAHGIVMVEFDPIEYAKASSQVRENTGAFKKTRIAGNEEYGKKVWFHDETVSRWNLDIDGERGPYRVVVEDVARGMEHWPRIVSVYPR